MKRKERRILLVEYLANEFSILVKDYFKENGSSCYLSSFLPENRYLEVIEVYPIIYSKATLKLNEIISFDIEICYFKKFGHYNVQIKHKEGINISFDFHAHGWDGDLKGEKIILEDNAIKIRQKLKHIMYYSFSLIQFKEY